VNERDARRETALADRLRALIRADAVLMAQLRAARALGLAQWCIGAGALRDRVWNDRFGPAPATGDADVDLAWYDDEPASPARDAALAARLATALPGTAWDVTHQGHVHEWLAAPGGGRWPKLGSLDAGLATWPETATAVGACLKADDHLALIAPFGLADLFDGVIRHNPARADARTFLDRVAAKRWQARWPGLLLLPPAAAPRPAPSDVQRDPAPGADGRAADAFERLHDLRVVRAPEEPA